MCYLCVRNSACQWQCVSVHLIVCKKTIEFNYNFSSPPPSPLTLPPFPLDPSLYLPFTVSLAAASHSLAFRARLAPPLPLQPGRVTPMGWGQGRCWGARGRDQGLIQGPGHTPLPYLRTLWEDSMCCTMRRRRGRKRGTGRGTGHLQAAPATATTQERSSEYMFRSDLHNGRGAIGEEEAGAGSC